MNFNIAHFFYVAMRIVYPSVWKVFVLILVTIWPTVRVVSWSTFRITSISIV